VGKSITADVVSASQWGKMALLAEELAYHFDNQNVSKNAEAVWSMLPPALRR